MTADYTRGPWAVNGAPGPAAAVLSDGANLSITKQMQRSALMKAAGGLARRVAAASVHPDAATHAGAETHR